MKIDTKCYGQRSERVTNGTCRTNCVWPFLSLFVSLGNNAVGREPCGLAVLVTIWNTLWLVLPVVMQRGSPRKGTHYGLQSIAKTGRRWLWIHHFLALSLSNAFGCKNLGLWFMKQKHHYLKLQKLKTDMIPSWEAYFQCPDSFLCVDDLLFLPESWRR